MKSNNDWTMIGLDVLYFSQSYNQDGREFPLQPRAAKIVGFTGGDRYTVLVFNDGNRNANLADVVRVRSVLLCKPGEQGNERLWICDRADMPKNGDWTLPPSIVEAPAPPTKTKVPVGAAK
jgi:hypothetical protein